MSTLSLYVEPQPAGPSPSMPRFPHLRMGSHRPRPPYLGPPTRCICPVKVGEESTAWMWGLETLRPCLEGVRSENASTWGHSSHPLRASQRRTRASSSGWPRRAGALHTGWPAWGGGAEEPGQMRRWGGIQCIHSLSVRPPPRWEQRHRAPSKHSFPSKALSPETVAEGKACAVRLHQAMPSHLALQAGSAPAETRRAGAAPAARGQRGQRGHLPATTLAPRHAAPGPPPPCATQLPNWALMVGPAPTETWAHTCPPRRDRQGVEGTWRAWPHHTAGLRPAAPAPWSPSPQGSSCSDLYFHCHFLLPTLSHSVRPQKWCPASSNPGPGPGEGVPPGGAVSPELPATLTWGQVKGAQTHQERALQRCTGCDSLPLKTSRLQPP